MRRKIWISPRVAAGARAGGEKRVKRVDVRGGQPIQSIVGMPLSLVLLL